MFTPGAAAQHCANNGEFFIFRAVLRCNAPGGRWAGGGGKSSLTIIADGGAVLELGLYVVQGGGAGAAPAVHVHLQRHVTCTGVQSWSLFGRKKRQFCTKIKAILHEICQKRVDFICGGWGLQRNL